MTWLLWRQHRVQVAIAAVLLALFAVPVLITGRALADRLTACRTGTTCGGVFEGYQAVNTVVDLTVMVPLLLGVFWGAAVAGRELETGTAGLVWTQSVTRRRWVTSKLAALLGLTLVCSAADSALVTWWSNTHNTLVESRLAGIQFDIQGVAPVAYTLFAVALGLASGALWRRTVPAMATTVGGFVAVRLIIELYARQHFMTPIVSTVAFTKTDPVPAGALSISTDLIVRGHVVTGPMEVPARCADSASRTGMDQCLHDLGWAVRATYQPAGRYWSLQWIEFGIFTALAAVLVAVGVTALLRRDA